MWTPHTSMEEALAKIRAKIPPPLPVSRGHPLPLSLAQERLWFLDQLAPGMYSSYNATFLTGQLDIVALEQGLNEVIRRHESLRTNYKVIDGRPVQVIDLPERVSLSVVDLQKLPGNECEAEAWRLITKNSQRPFKLDQDMLFRCTLLKLGTEEYVFLLIGHCVLFDEGSVSIFFQELAELYEAFSKGRPSPLPELTIQYADFVDWQRRHLAETRKMHLSYWRQCLAGDLSTLQLPTDYPRMANQTFKGARQSLVLPESLSDALKALSCQEEITLFMLLLAGFQTLLYRYTGQSDVTVVSPVDARSRAQFEGLIGCFVNMLVLRAKLSGDPSFQELLGRVRSVTLEALSHQDLPFETMVQELGLESSLRHHWPFQVMFAFHKAPFLQLPNLAAKHMVSYNLPAKLDLILCVTEIEHKLTLTFEYNADLFYPESIARMSGHLKSLLAGIVANPSERISALPILSKAERQQLLVEWNNTQLDYPRGLCLHQRFEAQVTRVPDSVAVTCNGKQLTYQELNCQANQLAHYLQALDVGPETVVGLCVERSIEMAVGLLGILKAGGVCLKLDPASPRERLAFVVKDAKATVVLTQSRFVDALPGDKVHLVCLDQMWAMIATGSKENVESEVMVDHACFVMYTSGSTGAPKGVITSHRSECSWQLPETAPYRLTEADVFLLTVYATGDMFWPWLSGARVVIANDVGYKDSAYLVRLVAQEQVTFAYFVPSMLRVFLEEEGLDACACLKRIRCGGEPLSVELQERFFARLGIELHNYYALTEAGTIIWDCRRRDNRRFVPIGRPTANTRVYLLDSRLRLVPIGVPGEICIGGAEMARGYLNRPDLTAEKFIPDPFSDEPGARIYRTGDLARYLPDGNIDFLGRLDHQVKIRGFRIELGEIEAVLSQHPAVRKAVVLASDDVPGDRRLIAYLVPSQEEPVPAYHVLRRFLAKKLPDHMIPAAFVFLDAIPLTPNGKVDRRKLPAPDLTRLSSKAPFVAPRTLAEEVVARIWTQVLGVEQVGVYDNFFELGGHSLLAIQVISRLRRVFQVEIPLHTLFEMPTISSLVDEIAQAWGESGVVEEIARTFRELEQLSEDEVKILLQEITER